MEHRIWLLLVMVLLFSFAVLVMAAAVLRLAKAVKHLHDVARDQGQTLSAVVSAQDNAAQQRYVANMEALDEIRHGRKAT